ncbi:MAG: DHHA1 domain-containing protein [Candidatus Methanomethylophilaceae archaeon]|nr:DHHA1 domain-containing protein [Candidatus Methanomethylophilaceae archaeon]MDY0225157.1 DHHA1 domain-containing protein [Candidatus Methanomethylophilaceae archaeon]
MTEEIFRHDGYAFEFEALVVSVDGDLIELDMTAFYPGGGGQVCDTGTIRGLPVTDVSYKEKNIVHTVPNNDLKVGDRVWCSVDWYRRYDLMMGHTAEHLLFCSLKKQDPELTITKIFISPESKYVIVNHDISWEKIDKALKFANKAILDALPVTKSIMSRDDPELANVRIKLDHIKENEEISVVSIGDIDLSACSGVHVMETSEIETLFVDRKVSAGKDGVAIHFKVGNAAKESAMSLANICLQTIDEANSKPEDIVRTVSNMKREIELSREMIKKAVKQQLTSLEPENYNGINIYSGIFYADRTILTDTAENLKNKGGVIAFVSVTDTVSVLMASGNSKINCKKILPDILKEFGGRGGGKPDFAQGGISNISAANDILKIVLERIKQSL